MNAQPSPSACFWRQVIVDLTVMSIVGLMLGLIGPFGTFADPVAQRLIYWMGLSYAGYICYRPMLTLVVRLGQRLDLPDMGSWVLACLLATVPMAAFVWWIGFLARPFLLPTLEQALGTYGSVLLVGGGITALFTLLERRGHYRMADATGSAPVTPSVSGVEADLVPEARPAFSPPEPGFLDHLPAELGSDLIALEMEDHYVRAHTALGSELVLMRLRDAMAQLDRLDGLQVHRSWWVARHAVEDVKREGRNVRLILPRGLEAPVSRANVTMLKDAGWL